MLGLEADGSEIRSAHESPFWQGAAAVSESTDVPVMLTGGFRTRDGIDQALHSGVAAMVGVGRPLAVRPELAGELLRGETDLLDRPALAELLEAAQLRHLEEAVPDVALLVEEDVDLPVALEAGDGVDRDVASRHGPHPFPSARPPFRWLEDRLKR